jgi:hypothetical protein
MEAYNKKIRDNMLLMNQSYENMKVAFVYDEPRYSIHI